MKAAPMAENTSPLDAALESIEREELGGTAPKVESPDADPFSPPPPADVEPEVPKKRGRPVNPNSRRARAGVYSGAASGKVKNPPVPEVRPDYSKIAPASVAASIKQIDAIIVKLAGTAPLSEEEAQGGGAVFAPVLDHYMPLLAEKGGMWLAPFTWVVLAYGPRAYEVLDRRQHMLEAKKRGYTAPVSEEARSGETGTTTFPASDPVPVPPLSVVRTEEPSPTLPRRRR